MIVEFTVETGTYEGAWEFAASASVEIGGDYDADPVYVARQIWDEAYTSLQGCRRRLTTTTFGAPDGDVVARTERRP